MPKYTALLCGLWQHPRVYPIIGLKEASTDAIGAWEAAILILNNRLTRRKRAVSN